MTDLDQAELTFSMTFAYSPTDYTSARGDRESSDVSLAAIPAIFVTMPLDEGRVVVGVGLTSPYGQAQEWDRDGLFKGAAPDFAEMKTAGISP